MKTKISLLLALAFIFSACSKTPVGAPPKVEEMPVPQGEISATGDELPSVPSVKVEVTPRDVQGADVSGKAQDMPEGTKEGEHTSDPLQAPSIGDTVPNPVSN